VRVERDQLRLQVEGLKNDVAHWRATAEDAKARADMLKRSNAFLRAAMGM